MKRRARHNGCCHVFSFTTFYCFLAFNNRAEWKRMGIGGELYVNSLKQPARVDFSFRLRSTITCSTFSCVSESKSLARHSIDCSRQSMMSWAWKYVRIRASEEKNHFTSRQHNVESRGHNNSNTTHISENVCMWCFWMLLINKKSHNKFQSATETTGFFSSLVFKLLSVVIYPQRMQKTWMFGLW